MKFLNSLITGNYYEVFKIPQMQSMQSTLKPGDLFVVDKKYFQEHPLRRGQVVVYRAPEDLVTVAGGAATKKVARIVGLAGETVEVRGPQLLINGQAVDESYAVWVKGGIYDFKPAVVPEGKVFLLGDNRDLSRDARFWKDPFLDQKLLVGRVAYIYLPADLDLNRALKSLD